MNQAALAEVDLTGSEPTEGQEADSGTIWDQGTLAKVAAFAGTMQEISEHREELNARKAAAIAELVNMGFNRDAIAAALKYHNTPEDKRENFDLSYIYARKAFGQPIQDDLFVAATREQIEIAKTEQSE